MSTLDRINALNAMLKEFKYLENTANHLSREKGEQEFIRLLNMLRLPLLKMSAFSLSEASEMLKEEKKDDKTPN